MGSKFKYDDSVVRYCYFAVEPCVDVNADGGESGRGLSEVGASEG